MRILLLITLFLTSCGVDTLSTSNTKSSQDNVVDNFNSESDYQNEYCGNVYYQQGQNGGSDGYFLTTSQNQRYSLAADENSFIEDLGQMSLPLEMCVYTNKEVELGFEGYIIPVQNFRVLN